MAISLKVNGRPARSMPSRTRRSSTCCARSRANGAKIRLRPDAMRACTVLVNARLDAPAVTPVGSIEETR